MLCKVPRSGGLSCWLPSCRVLTRSGALQHGGSQTKWLGYNEMLADQTFRYDPRDPESKKKLASLLSSFGVSLPEFFSENFSQLIENLVWRQGASAVESDGAATLQVLLDLGEGDEIQLATIRAGKISAVRHVELPPKSGSEAPTSNSRPSLVELFEQIAESPLQDSSQIQFARAVEAILNGQHRERFARLGSSLQEVSPGSPCPLCRQPVSKEFVIAGFQNPDVR
jgi:hypothetical protein